MQRLCTAGRCEETHLALTAQPSREPRRSRAARGGGGLFTAGRCEETPFTHPPLFASSTARRRPKQRGRSLEHEIVRRVQPSSKEQRRADSRCGGRKRRRRLLAWRSGGRLVRAPAVEGWLKAVGGVQLLEDGGLDPTLRLLPSPLRSLARSPLPLPPPRRRAPLARRLWAEGGAVDAVLARWPVHSSKV